MKIYICIYFPEKFDFTKKCRMFFALRACHQRRKRVLVKFQLRAHGDVRRKIFLTLIPTARRGATELWLRVAAELKALGFHIL